MGKNAPTPIPSTISASTRVGIIAARFNAPIVDELLHGCRTRLLQLGLSDDQISTVRVPGAFELPVAALAMAKSGKVAAVICLGAVVRGDTPHFDYVAGEAARGIQHVALQTGVPIIFGVLTTNTQEQAEARIDTDGLHGHAGERAAEAAIEMATVLNAIRKG